MDKIGCCMYVCMYVFTVCKYSMCIFKKVLG